MEGALVQDYILSCLGLMGSRHVYDADAGMRKTVEATSKINIGELARAGLLAENVMSLPFARFCFAGVDYVRCDRYHIELLNSRTPQSSCRFQIQWTRCHFGNARPWFVCLCRQRVATLFYNGRDYRCRTCCNLIYESQRKGVVGRRRLKSTRIRQGRLGGKAFPASIPSRPYRMHERTYRRLCTLLDTLETGLKRYVRPRSRRLLRAEMDQAARAEVWRQSKRAERENFGRRKSPITP